MTFRRISTSVLVAVTLPLASASSVGAEDAAFSAEANGAAMRVTTFFDKAPGTSTPFEGPGPVAHAALDAFGSGAFASFPFPGSTAVVAPSLAAGLIPGFPSPPAYPFYVASDHPLVPKAEQRMGTVDLSAQSTAQSSEASATVNKGQGGQGVGALAANALSAARDDEVAADAVGAVTSFAAGPLTLGKVSATASIKLGRDGRLAKVSSLEISAARFGDVIFGIGPSGFVLPGTSTPLPKEGMEQLLAGLAKAGLELHYVGARETADSISSASLEVRQHFELPNGKNTVTWMLGQASARITTAKTEAEQASGGITESPGPSDPAATIEPAPPAAESLTPDPRGTAAVAPVSPPAPPEPGGTAELGSFDSAPAADIPPAEAQLAASQGSKPTMKAAPVASSSRYATAPYGVLGVGAMLFVAVIIAGGARRRHAS
jgi:hypothetical protein